MKKITWASVQPLNGGMSIGFEQAIGHPPEYVITCGFPHDKHYQNYLRQRGHQSPFIVMDGSYTEFASPEDELMFHEYKDVDIVQFVPICSGLSMLNAQNDPDSSKCRGCADNDQNQNMYQTTRLILERINPKVAVFENAPAAYTASGAAVVEYLKRIARDYGYNVTLEKTDTYCHGIPQHRKRTFIYFWRNDVTEFAPYLEYENIQTPMLADYLKMIPTDAPSQELFPINISSSLDFTYDYIMGVVAKDGENVFDVFKRYEQKKSATTGLFFIEREIGFDVVIKHFESMLDEIPDPENCPIEIKYIKKALKTLTHAKVKIAMNKGYWDSSMVVYPKGEATNAIISKNLIRILHPAEDRALNLRELLWLMGMPHDYELLDGRKFWPHLTQSVPVATSKHVGEMCRKYVLGELEISESQFVKQNNEKQRIDLEEELFKLVEIEQVIDEN